MSPDQKQLLLVGGGVGGLALLVTLLGQRARAAPQAGQLQMQAPGQHAPVHVRSEHGHKRRRRYEEARRRGEHGENGRGEYGRKRKHRRHHGD